MSKRKFKEELLEALVPEIYGPAADIKPDIKPDVKPRALKRVKKREKKNETQETGLLEDGVEFVRSFAPRRRVQWRGRKVKRVLRPGTAVVFTPGERSATRALKREYDEVYADEDILEQAAQQIGEFAYGKRGRYGEVGLVLDQSNPTPSLKPVTLQHILPVTESKRGIKRESGDDLQPTMQLMVPKRQKLEDVLENMKVDPSIEPEVKVRPIKEIGPGLGVQTVDIQLPVRAAASAVNMPVEVMETQTDESPATAVTTRDMGLQTEPWYEFAASARRARARRYTAANHVLPEYALHPSITPTPGYRGVTFTPNRSRTTRRRRRTSRRRSRRIVPVSVRRVIRRGRTLTLPNARYHPSIVI